MAPGQNRYYGIRSTIQVAQEALREDRLRLWSPGCRSVELGTLR